MTSTLNKIAALLALLIGAMAIFAGGQVLLGRDPGYYVIDWLPVYNFSVGILSVFPTALFIWRKSKYALSAVLATFGAHAIVMLTLQIGYSSVVAADSIRAMTLRLSVWLVILVLMLIQTRRTQTAVN